MAQNI